MLSMQMELPENPEFPGPGKPCREMTAALLEPTPGRMSVMLLITEKQTDRKSRGELSIFPFKNPQFLAPPLIIIPKKSDHK